jgi:hypothetical protein
MPLADRLALAAVMAAALTASDYSSAKRKIDLIENEQATPGSRVVLTARELVAYAARELPEGVRDPSLQLGENSATGFAYIDFLKVRAAMGEAPPNALIAGLLEGERPVRVAARMISAGGRATIDVDSVEISGVVLSGRALEFMIKYFLIPNYPDAKVGEPFQLHHHVDHIQVRPGGVTVFIGAP